MSSTVTYTYPKKVHVSPTVTHTYKKTVKVTLSKAFSDYGVYEIDEDLLVDVVVICETKDLDYYPLIVPAIIPKYSTLVSFVPKVRKVRYWRTNQIMFKELKTKNETDKVSFYPDEMNMGTAPIDDAKIDTLYYTTVNINIWNDNSIGFIITFDKKLVTKEYESNLQNLNEQNALKTKDSSCK